MDLATMAHAVTIIGIPMIVYYLHGIHKSFAAKAKEDAEFEEMLKPGAGLNLPDQK